MMNFLDAAGLFAECWDLYKKYYGQDMDDRHLECFKEEMDEVYKKYGRQDFAKDMVLAVIFEIERIDKTRHNAGEHKGKKGICD